MAHEGGNWWDSPHAGNMDSRAVLGPERQTALGDPMRWGGRVNVTCNLIGQFAATEAIVRAQCKDPYGRQWALCGNLEADAALWDATNDEWAAFLDVILGVGQMKLAQSFDLRALVNLASPWYGVRRNGTRLIKPWFIDGGLVGAAIDANPRYILVDPPIVGTTTVVGCEAMLAPRMAGQGL